MHIWIYRDRNIDTDTDTHAHTNIYAHMHARTRTHARTHTRTHKQTNTYTVTPVMQHFSLVVCLVSRVFLVTKIAQHCFLASYVRNSKTICTQLVLA